jgi:hypothetical protein
MVAVKRIGLEGLKEEEISQLMREVDLVKRLSHPSIVKYEGMARDENTLSIVLECVRSSSFYMPLPACPLLRILPFFTLAHTDCCAPRVYLQIRREWFSRTNSQGVRQAKREVGGELRFQDPRRARLPTPKRRRALRPQGSQHPHDEDRQRKAIRLWCVA